MKSAMDKSNLKPATDKTPTVLKNQVFDKTPKFEKKSFGDMKESETKSIHMYPKSLTFGFHTAEDIRKISVVQVVDYRTFNALDDPTPRGLYDPLMGPYAERDKHHNQIICSTCIEPYSKCPGHYGHIELPLPVNHPLFLRNLVAIIKLTCPVCKRFFTSDSNKAMLTGQLKLLDYGQLILAQELKKLVPKEKNEEDRKSSRNQEDNETKKEAKKEAIEAKVQSLLEESGALEWEEKPQPSRHVEGMRQLLINDFKKQATTKGKCATCEGGWKKIVLYKSRIIYSLKPGTVSTVMGGHLYDIPEAPGIAESEERGEQGKKKRKSGSTLPTRFLTPMDARDHLREVWNNERDLFGQLFPVLRTISSENPTDIFFLDVIPVIPSKFRPMNYTNGSLKENGHSLLLRKIIQEASIARAAVVAQKKGTADSLPKEAQAMLNSLQGETLLDKYLAAWLNLQESVNSLADSTNSKDYTGVGFRQVMEKKEGLLRTHMMGKRVNFAARSVITPDPNLDVEELGVPEIFAKKLSFRTPVTAWNIHELRELVRNGPNVHPGALAIEEENGKLMFLSATNAAQREEFAKMLMTPTDAAIKASQRNGGRLSQVQGQPQLFKPKIVHRHLQTGDVMLLNRQPTLHKPSIMAHRVRVLPGEKTLRIHYAACKAYNADFDGDEMNAHFPQNQVARSEAYNIVALPHQYLVPKDGTPLSGLIQDHMIAGVRLTIRGRFFNRADYQQLVYSGLGKHCSKTKLLPPAIIKPFPLWSGKQVLSTIIMNLTPKGKPLINIESTAKISVKDWQNGKAREWKAGGTPLPNAQSMTESQVIIRHGELLVGVLDKMHYGATSYGLVHSCCELYGSEFSCRLLSSLARLFTYFLQLHGFTLGVEDILLKESADKKRKKILAKAQKMGDKTAARAVGLDPEDGSTTEVDMAEVKRRLAQGHLSGSALKRTKVDREYKTLTDDLTNQVNRACIPHGLLQAFPDNNLAIMIQSGAKGSSVNAMQISCLLGQIELEGKRPPLMISGRSLPSFLPYDTSPRAGGFVAGRFMTGIRPQEFFFHCMAGREGLIDTAVKTARSGYLQRCLIKHLEGISVAYDQTVRDSDGAVIQFNYGEDGLDICKSQYLNEKSIPFLVENSECVRLLSQDALKQDQESQDQVKAAQKEVKRFIRKRGELTSKERKGAFLNYSSQYQIDPDQKAWVGRKIRPGRSLATEQLEEVWRQMDSETKAAYYRRQEPAPDPVSARYPPCRHADVLVERLQAIVDRYLERPDAKIGRKQLTRMIYSKSIEAAAAPGEPVGVLAAQSIGEPSTQMTLNTFHFAGRGDMNVTLGIPRLREILMTASAKIQTPSMEIPLLLKGSKGKKKAERFKLQLTRVTLADVLEKIDVTEQLQISAGNSRSRIYSLKFHFLPRESYKDRFCVKPKQILRYFEDYFVAKVLLPGIQKEADAQSQQSLFVANAATKRSKRPTKNGEEDGGEEDEAEKSMVKVKNGVDDDDGDSDAEIADDIGTSAEKARRNRDDDKDYEEDDVDEGKSPDVALFVDEGDEGFEEEEKTEEVTEEAVEQEQPEYHMTAEMEQAVEDRKNQLLEKDEDIIDYEFDAAKELWCRVTLSIPLSVHKVDMSSSLRTWAESAIVYQVPRIKRAVVGDVKSEDDDVIIRTEGVNIQAMFKYSKILDLNRLYCNDIHQISQQYGVEAASTVIMREVRNVFKVYGITVDPRHLTLVASYMTAGGSYRPFNRYGLQDSTSPLQQMTFETATEFMKNAVLQGKTDQLKSPSARLVMGLPGLEGTGSFGLLHKLY